MGNLNNLLFCLQEGQLFRQLLYEALHITFSAYSYMFSPFQCP